MYPRGRWGRKCIAHGTNLVKFWIDISLLSSSKFLKWANHPSLSLLFPPLSYESFLQDRTIQPFLPGQNRSRQLTKTLLTWKSPWGTVYCYSKQNKGGGLISSEEFITEFTPKFHRYVPLIQYSSGQASAIELWLNPYHVYTENWSNILTEKEVFNEGEVAGSYG